MKVQHLIAALLIAVSCNGGLEPEVEPWENGGETGHTIQPGSEEGQDDGGGEQAEDAFVKVTTGGVMDITGTTAKLAGSYSDANATVYDRGFYYGTTQEPATPGGLGSSPDASGVFFLELSSLEPGTVYYYVAYVTIWDDEARQYVEFRGEVKQFTTEEDNQPGGPAGLQYLGCYEMPAIDLRDQGAASDSGPECFGTTSWFRYDTHNPDQSVITHTYEYEGSLYRNWTALVDADKKAPLWSAFVMHAEAYPKVNSGRKGDWTPDPGIPGSWQRCFASSTHSRGHFVASEYRQTTVDANKQTFLYTNQAPQYQNSFNGGIWSSLENAVVANAPTGRDTLYVVVGILYEDPDNFQTPNSGGDPVLCPSHFYKCLMKCSFDTSGAMTAAKGVAYLFENKPYSGSYTSYATSIDAIEERSGWDFYTNVPAALQDPAESSSTPLW